jgi:membrane protein implicated in regulation of membrane protease activity
MWWLWVAWLILGLVLLGIELHTQAFFAVFIALGAFAATIVAVVALDLWVQAVVFAAVAGAGVLLLRPVVARAARLRMGPALRLPGASDSLIGHSAVTLDPVGDENHPGHARLAGESYLAVTREPGGLPPETHVKVIEVRGTTLVVVPNTGG